MAFDFPKDQLRTVIATLSGVPESRVRWEGEAERVTLSIGGKAGKITLNIVAMAEGDALEARRSFDEETNTLSEQWGATEGVTVSVRADNFLGMGAAYNLLRRMRFELGKPSTPSKAALRAAGLVYVEAPSIVKLDYEVDNRAVSSASMDLRLTNLVTDEPVAVPYIEKLTSQGGPFTNPEAAALPVVDVKVPRP